MRRNRVIQLATALCMSTAAATAYAHHSYGMFYDLCTRVTIEGQIENVQWKSPHVWIDLKLDDGTAYGVEWTSPQTLAVAGLTSEAVKAGDRIAVTGSPSRNSVMKVISALTEIRRASDSWSWTRSPGSTPPECAGK